jgi:hypothetical protein
MRTEFAGAATSAPPSDEVSPLRRVRTVSSRASPGGAGSLDRIAIPSLGRVPPETSMGAVLRQDSRRSIEHRAIYLTQTAPSDCGCARPNLWGPDARGHPGAPRRRRGSAVGCGHGPEPAGGGATRGRQPCPARNLGGAPSGPGVGEVCRGARTGARWCSQLSEVHSPNRACERARSAGRTISRRNPEGGEGVCSDKGTPCDSDF